MQYGKAQGSYISDRIEIRTVETKSIDLDRAIPGEREIVDLSSAGDLRWSAILSLPPQAKVALDILVHNDMYVLKGSLIEETIEFPAGAFLSRTTGKGLRAGHAGVRLFMYRDRVVMTSREETLRPGDLKWYPGGVKGMSVAPLLYAYHRLMLVSWLPSTRVDFHIHPLGEEILVLEGELIDQKDRHPAGTWQRFLPGTGHAPYTETTTLILLRNGHLSR